MPIDAPLRLYEGTIPPEWIDYNGHMNVAYYVLAFDHATDGLMDYLGMDEAYRQRTRCSAFVLEAHINYRQELVEGDPIACTTQLLGFDSKRVHFFHRMYHRDEDFLAATTEILLLHVDLSQRRSASMPRDMLDRLGALMTRHIQLPRPPETGRCIGIPKAS
jgi:acyl-CoA thioester hydrolase